MNEITFAPSVPAVLILAGIVIQVCWIFKMRRDEMVFLRKQNERLIEENRSYHQMFIQMIDQRLFDSNPLTGNQ